MLCSGVVVMREEKLPASCTELSTFSPLGSTAVRIEGLAELIPPGHLKTALRPFGVQPTGRLSDLAMMVPSGKASEPLKALSLAGLTRSAGPAWR